MIEAGTRHTARNRPPGTDGRLLALTARQSAQDDDDVGVTQTALLTHSVDTKLGGNVLRGSLHARILVEDRRRLGRPSVGVCRRGSGIAGLVEDRGLLAGAASHEPSEHGPE